MLGSTVLLLPVGIYRRCWGKISVAKKLRLQILSGIAVLPNGECYISCAALQLLFAEEKFQLPKSLYCSIEQYCSIAKRRILHKLRRITVANCVYCRCWVISSAVPNSRKLHIPLSTGVCSRCWVALQMLINIAVAATDAVAMWRYSTVVRNKAS